MTWHERRRRRAELDQQLEEHLADLHTATRRLEAETAEVNKRSEKINERARHLIAGT